MSGLEMAPSRKNELVTLLGDLNLKKIGSGANEETGSHSVQSNQDPINAVDARPSKTVLSVEFKLK
jgi:hypothetical protein